MVKSAYLIAEWDSRMGMKHQTKIHGDTESYFMLPLHLHGEMSRPASGPSLQIRHSGVTTGVMADELVSGSDEIDASEDMLKWNEYV
jgi:hypothetical protein